MTTAISNVHKKAKLVVRRDFGSVRNLIRRIKISVPFADICLFGRRTRAQVIERLDRRDCDRSRPELPIYVTPVTFDGRHAESREDRQKKMYAITNEISQRGVGFKHDEPFEADYAIITVDLLDGCPVSLLLEVHWSNLEKGYTYMSGGRFVGITESVFEHDANDWH